MAAHATVDGGYAYELPSWAQGLTFGEDKVAPEITSEHISAIAPSVAVRRCVVIVCVAIVVVFTVRGVMWGNRRCQIWRSNHS